MNPKDKLWCVYGWEFPLRHIGRVSSISETGGTIYVKYDYEIDPQPWDPKYVKRFETIGEAIDHVVSNGFSEHEIIGKVERDFPKLFKVNYPNLKNVNMDRIL